MQVTASLVDTRPSTLFSRVCISTRHEMNLSPAPVIKRIPIAALHPNFPYAGYKLEPNAKIFLVKRSGHVTAVLNATAQPRDGGRWVQIDENWSLQNLLALGFERLTR